MSTCQRCGAEFACGMIDLDGDSSCWCTQIPPLPSSAYVAGDTSDGHPSCFCPQCLRALVAMQRSADAGGNTLP